MGKPTGFLEFERNVRKDIEPLERIENFDEFHQHLSRKEQSKQGARCMDCGVPFCQNGQMIQGMVSGCPLNNLIPEWNDLIFRNNYPAALKRLLKTNNFPEFTSRVCPALCEAACTCSLHGDAVTVRENEYGIIEYGYRHDLMKPCKIRERIDIKIAVVGSGPAGLATADSLNKRGYKVTVIEKNDRVGGLLMYGIPNMKLDKSVIERRVDLMKQEGVEFITNRAITTKEDAEELMKEYDSVVLACGASKPRDINVPGRDGNGIYFAVDYLSKVTKSVLNETVEYPATKGENVLVIGGGDTGNDCVGSVIRLGCQSVTQLEMMPEPPKTRAENNPWPEWPRIKKTDYGQEESIAVFGKDPRVYETTVKEFIRDENGELKQAVLVSLERKNENGRFVMVAKEGSERTVDVDLVLIAAGFVGCDEKVADAFSLEVNARGNIASDDHATNVEGVYVAGDMRRGQSLVVWAIREGRDAARKVDLDYFGYSGIQG